MRRLALMVLAVVVSCAGCTSLRPIAATPEELRARINSGQLLKPGDRVIIVTTDQNAHRFVVTGVADGVIAGRSDSVPVAEVVALEKPAPDSGKTFELVGGILLGLIVIGSAIALGSVHPSVGYH
jgi:hypothetical protein